MRGGNYSKVTQILEGAGTRNDTTRAALATLGEAECNVLLHDAVRSLVTQTIIAANVEALQTCEAVDTAITSADTVIELEGATGTIADVLPRHRLHRGQTPQSFRLQRSLRPTRRPLRMQTSPPPTTAPLSCATCPRCRSRLCPDTSGT